MCGGFPRHQAGARYTVPCAYSITAHPSGQHYARPPAYYKHQKLLATPGQRTRVDKKSSGVIFQGPMHGSSCILNHTYRSQCLRSASMKQPTMYSYMASHRYLYQIRFTPLISHYRIWTQPFRFIIQTDQTRHDSKHSRHCKQSWMRKHNKAQAVATHAKWFQLFTVTKSGHAKEWVQLPTTCIVESCLS